MPCGACQSFVMSARSRSRACVHGCCISRSCVHNTCLLNTAPMPPPDTDDDNDIACCCGAFASGVSYTARSNCPRRCRINPRVILVSPSSPAPPLRNASALCALFALAVLFVCRAQTLAGRNERRWVMRRHVDIFADAVLLVCWLLSNAMCAPVQPPPTSNAPRYIHKASREQWKVCRRLLCALLCCSQHTRPSTKAPFHP